MTRPIKMTSILTGVYVATLTAVPALSGCGEDDEKSENPPPEPAPGADVPPDQHFVAEGLHARAVATGQGSLRQISFTSNGDLIGVTVPGAIMRYRDVDGDGMFFGGEEIIEIGNTGGPNGNNAHLDEDAGFLYAGTEDGVRRWRYSADDELGASEDVIVGEPSSGTHRFHTVHVYDGFLYVHSGSENNAVAPAAPDYDADRAVLKRFDLAEFSNGTEREPFEWEQTEPFAIGLRNMVGYTRNAQGRMYGVVNGLDDLMYGGEDIHLDNPGDDLVLLEQGSAHGYPYCFTAQHVMIGDEVVTAGTRLASAVDPSKPDPDFENPHDDAWCRQNAEPPLTFFPAHSAPLDIAFYDNASSALPEQWVGGAFVPLHGSWDTEPSVGHKVVWVPFDGSGDAPMPTATALDTSFEFEVVFGGGKKGEHVDGAWGWSAGEVGETLVRPVSVAISPLDGGLYVSSDNASVIGAGDSPAQGAIYRIALD